jgi:hypothetical protein
MLETVSKSPETDQGGQVGADQQGPEEGARL